MAKSNQYHVGKQELMDAIWQSKLLNSYVLGPNDPANPNEFKSYDQAVKSRKEILDDGRIYRMSNSRFIPKQYTKGGDLAANQSKHYPSFSCFQYQDGILVEVLRSPWIGDLQTGHYPSRDEIQFTPELWDLCHKMAIGIKSKHNWSGYDSDWVMEALSKVVRNILKFDESKYTDPNPYSYLYTAINNEYLLLVKKHNDLQKHEVSTISSNGVDVLDSILTGEANNAPLESWHEQVEREMKQAQENMEPAPVKVINPITDPERWAEMQRQYGNPDFTVKDITPDYIKDWEAKCRKKAEKAANDPIRKGREASIKRRRAKKKDKK